MQKLGKAFIFLFSSGILFSYVAGTVPIWGGLVDPSCFVTVSECPNEHINFWLYSNENQHDPILLDAQFLYAEHFYPPRPVKILIHGYTGHHDFPPSSYIRPVLLQHEEVYVISVDYEPLVRKPCYLTGVANVPVVSRCLAELINILVDSGIVDNEDIHIIGYSLGAHVAGQTANFVHHKLKHITGLDPARPMFASIGTDGRLDANDAEFVDIIHTDVLGRGILSAMGHVDFYPNIGSYQPGCKKQEISAHEVPGSCNHDRAPQYYAESIVSQRGFWSYYCPTWFHKVFGLCRSRSNDALMGYWVDENIRGTFFLETAAHPPFALGSVFRSQGYQQRYTREFNKNEEIDEETFELQSRALEKTIQKMNISEIQSLAILQSYCKDAC